MRDGESRTAALVAAGRAAAHGRTSVTRFSDPTAAVLLPDDMRARVEAYVAMPAPPDGVRPRLEYLMLRANEALMVPRTVAIDDAIRASSAAQLVNLGAGLDGRAWRLPELADTVVFEVDHPASQATKRQRAAALTPLAREVRFVPVDFSRDDLATSLAAAGHDPLTPTLWVWEGVVPYLTGTEIRATLDVLSRRSAAQSTLVIAYQSPSAARFVGRLLFSLMRRGRGEDVFENEPQRSFLGPARMRTLLEAHGFSVVRDQDLVELAEGMSADTSGMGAFPHAGRVVVACRSS
jgi:methyltransferase (TIGR00027 family)